MGNGFVFSLLAITSLNPSQIKYTKYQQVHSDKPMSGAGSPSFRPESVQ